MGGIMMENEKITIEKNGKTVECDVLFTFDCDATQKSYIGYTDHTEAANQRKNIYVSSYNPYSFDQTLGSITDEKELEMISDVLYRLDQDAEEGKEWQKGK